MADLNRLFVGPDDDDGISGIGIDLFFQDSAVIRYAQDGGTERFSSLGGELECERPFGAGDMEVKDLETEPFGRARQQERDIGHFTGGEGEITKVFGRKAVGFRDVFGQRGEPNGVRAGLEVLIGGDAILVGGCSRIHIPSERVVRKSLMC